MRQAKPAPSVLRVKPIEIWTRTLSRMTALAGSDAATLFDVVEAVAARQPDRVALSGENQRLTYAEFIRLAREHRDQSITHGSGRGAVTALLMRNSPAYVAIWAGVTQAGGVCALINTELSSAALAHSLRVSGATRAIVDPALHERLLAALDEAGLAVKIIVHESDVLSEGSRSEPTGPEALPRPRRCDDALLIFTSGTTGLPKAARVTHARILEWSFWFAGLMGAEQDDRLFDCLPLYHSTGGVCAVGAMLVSGGEVVVRTRFSAGRFWTDIAETGCTLFVYIGELCRYLVNAPVSPNETRHRLRLCCGNGMRADVWTSFEDRFGIQQIIEFYASTEGNVSLYNVEGKPGAIGRIPPFLRERFPIELIRLDSETGEPLRDTEGFCLRCGPDEAGEAIGRIEESGEYAFDGYTDPEATARKVLRDAFRKGDRWFRTGDLLRRDRAGFFSFVDRTGDTFRWKGENVSTEEVASSLARCPGVAGALVTGIEIPGHEGRAGFALIERNAAFDLHRLASHIETELASYQRPVLVRVCEEISRTGTFKYARPSITSPPSDRDVWFLDRNRGEFIPFDGALVEALRDGRIRL